MEAPGIFRCAGDVVVFVVCLVGMICVGFALASWLGGAL